MSIPKNLKIPMTRSRCGTILPRCTSTETGTLWSDLRTQDTICSCPFNITGFPLPGVNLCQQYQRRKTHVLCSRCAEIQKSMYNQCENAMKINLLDTDDTLLCIVSMMCAEMQESIYYQKDQESMQSM